MIRVPKVKLEVASSSFYFQGAIIYNNLPREIRMEKNYLKFKSLLKLIWEMYLKLSFLLDFKILE